MPATIGSFNIIREVGKSQLGTVYKAQDPKKKRTVALCLLPADTPQALEASRQYLRQAKAATVLDSPYIATIYGGAEEQGQVYVATEYVEGVPLDAALAAQQGFSSSELLDISRQVCRGLDHAHSKGIYHPRLTPAEIVTEWDGTVKIMGFAVDPGSLEGKSGNELCYMSPEQVQERAPDARSNVFNWGAILYELITGRKPFGKGDAESVLREILEVMPPSPNQLNPKVPVGISRVIMKALAKNPEYRFQHAGDLVSELETECSMAARPAVPGVPQVTAPPTQPAPPPPEMPSSTLQHEVLLGYSVPPPAVAATPAVPKPVAAAPSKAPETAPPSPPPPPPVTSVGGQVSLTPQQIKILVGVIGAALLVMVSVMIADSIRGRRLRAEAEAAAAAPLMGKAAPEPLIVAPVLPPAPEPTVMPAPVREPEPAPSPAQIVPAIRTPKTRRKAAVTHVSVASGALVVNSAPAGAQVQVDGNAAGLTPLSLANLTPGQHVVVLSKTGYATESRSVLVHSGTRAAVEVTLNQLAAIASIASDPPGASIFIDGRDTGRLTPAKLLVQKGSHSLLLRKTGYLDTSASMTLNAGQIFQFAPSLKELGNADDIKQVGKFKKFIPRGGQENSARVLVRTFPKGAQIMFNSRMMEHTSPAEFLLGPGTYEVTLTLSGYKTVRKRITVESNGRMEVNETFER